MKISIKLNIVLFILPLLIGFLIYILYSNNHYVNMIFPKAFLDNLKNQLPQNETIIQFFRNYLADGLWCFSLIMGLSLIFPKHYIISSVFGFSFGVLFEILQLIGAVKGTFSIGDIITYAVTALVAVIILKHSSNALKTKIKEKQK